MKKKLSFLFILVLTALLLCLPQSAYAGEDLGTLSAKTPSLNSIFNIKKDEEHILFFSVKGDASDCYFHLENLGEGDSTVEAYLIDPADNSKISSIALDEGYIGSTVGSYKLLDGKQYIISVANANFTGMDQIQVGVCIYSEGFGGSQFDYGPYWNEKYKKNDNENKSCETDSKASMKISEENITLKKGKTAKLKVTLPDKLKGTKVTWKSSDKKIAKVSKKGKVTAKGYGTAIITCTSKKDKTVYAQCTVVVAKKTDSINNGDDHKTVEASGDLSSVKLSSTNPVITYQYMSGFLVSAQRILTLKSNNYSGELTLEFECSGGPDIRTITVEKNKTYTLTYTYIAKKTPDQVIKQPDTQIMIGTDPITGLPKYTTVPGQSYTIYATPVSIPLKVSIVGGASNDATASFAGTLSKGSLKVE